MDQNINKDMNEADLIDVESLDFSDDQTWLCIHEEDSGQKVDLLDFKLNFEWPINEDEAYLKEEKDFFAVLDNILKNQAAAPDKHKFDSRTFVRPKKRPQRPSIQSIVEVQSNPPSLQNATQPNKYLTYNKYSNPLGPISPMLRLKTFNVDVNTENSSAIKDYAMKRRSMAPDDDPQLEDGDQSDEQTRFKPINIDFSQPAHNLHNTFNKGLNILSERSSLNMYQSGESLMRMSPPSLVSSLVMENSGNFNTESLEGKLSLTPSKEAVPGSMVTGRDSIDPMMTSMTLSILDEKDMSTSFFSQTTYNDHDSLIDSLPPSLVSSVNSSYIVSNTSRPKPDNPETNIFSSATFTHLEQSEKLLTARPRCQLFNTFKRDSIKNSESYTKAKEEACQSETGKILNENCDNVSLQAKESPKRQNGEMSETITLHYSNNKFRDDAEKENLNTTFEKDNAFFNDMELRKPEGKTSMNITMDKQELNEIIQARQKLSLARKALPDADKSPQKDTSPIKTIQLPNQTITVPRQSMENAAELLTRRRVMRQEESLREPPKRNATFKKTPNKSISMDSTVIYDKPPENNIIDINSATMNLIDNSDTTLQADIGWGLEDRAMVGSSESAETDTGTFSSSSPPEYPTSTPMTFRKGTRNELLNIHSTISPIYDLTNDKSYTVTKASDHNGMDKTCDMNTTVINSATLVKKSAPKRDILAGKSTPEKKITSPMQTKSSVPRMSPSHTENSTAMLAPSAYSRKTSLPTSKLRQYSSHRELNRIPGRSIPGAAGARTMLRRNVYASNPALSPTAAHPAPSHLAAPQRRQSVVIPQVQTEENGDCHVEKLSKPAMTAPPALVRQGTETLRRERPQSQLIQPKELRLTAAPATSASAVPVAMRNHYGPPPASRPTSIAGVSQLRVLRPSSVPLQRPAPVQTQAEARPQTGAERVSALPRPSRLPAPRRTMRPPSVYSVAPTADFDQY